VLPPAPYFFEEANMDGAPPIPAWFLSGLRDIDPGLVIYWNMFKSRFVIDRCINDAPHTHGIGCPRTHVMTVEDPEHGYMGPNDRILEKLRSQDAWTRYGGNDEAALLRQRAEHENAAAEWEAKRLEDARQTYRGRMLDDKAQLRHAIDLAKTFDIERVHK
jgi:hypothetical protein